MPFERPERPVDRVFLHCSASDNPDHDDIATIRAWHVDGNGWSDVGYHWFIRRDGTREAGRKLERIPAAQAGHNVGSLAVCLHGLAPENFAAAQYRALIGLAREIDRAYDGRVTFHGHCEVADKTCPVFPYAEVLGLDGAGRMTGSPTEDPRPARTVSAGNEFPILQVTSRGAAVRRLQDLLGRAGHALAVDGLFGRETLAAVRAFQAANGLRPDGSRRPRNPGRARRTACRRALRYAASRLPGVRVGWVRPRKFPHPEQARIVRFIQMPPREDAEPDNSRATNRTDHVPAT